MAGRGAAAAGFSRLHHEATGAATAGRAYRAPQQQSTTLYPQITPRKHIQFFDTALADSISKAAAFPGKTTAGTGSIQPTLCLTRVAWFQASVQAVGATVSFLRAHLRLAHVKVNQRRSPLLRLGEGNRICWRLPQPKSGMLEGSRCDAEKWQLRSGLHRARHHVQGYKEPVAVPKNG